MGLASGLPYEHPCADALEQILEWVSSTADLDALDYLQGALSLVSDRVDERGLDLQRAEVAPC
jgi:hypothetical protein